MAQDWFEANKPVLPTRSTTPAPTAPSGDWFADNKPTVKPPPSPVARGVAVTPPSAPIKRGKSHGAAIDFGWNVGKKLGGMAYDFLTTSPAQDFAKATREAGLPEAEQKRLREEHMQPLIDEWKSPAGKLNVAAEMFDPTGMAGMATGAATGEAEAIGRGDWETATAIPLAVAAPIAGAKLYSKFRARPTIVPPVEPIVPPVEPPKPGPNIYRAGETLNQLPEVAGADPRIPEGRAIIERARAARLAANPPPRMLPSHTPEARGTAGERFVSHPSGAVGDVFDINTEQTIDQLNARHGTQPLPPVEPVVPEVTTTTVRKAPKKVKGKVVKSEPLPPVDTSVVEEPAVTTRSDRFKKAAELAKQKANATFEGAIEPVASHELPPVDTSVVPETAAEQHIRQLTEKATKKNEYAKKTIKQLQEAAKTATPEVEADIRAELARRRKGKGQTLSSIGLGEASRILRAEFDEWRVLNKLPRNEAAFQKFMQATGRAAEAVVKEGKIAKAVKQQQSGSPEFDSPTKPAVKAPPKPKKVSDKPNWGLPPKTVNLGEGIDPALLPDPRLQIPIDPDLPSTPAKSHITQRLGGEEFRTQQGKFLPEQDFTPHPNEGASSYVKKTKTDVLPDVVGGGNKDYQEFLELGGKPRSSGEPRSKVEIERMKAKNKENEVKAKAKAEAEAPPVKFKDVTAAGANLRSSHKALLDNPVAAPIAEHLLDAHDQKVPWIRKTLQDAEPHIKGLGRNDRITLGKALDSGDFSKLTPDMAKRAAGLKKVFEDIHKKFPAGKNVGQITNYYTHMGEYTEPSLMRTFADLFKSEEVTVPKNPPGVGNLHQTGLGTPSSPYVKVRTGALKDIDFDIKNVLPKYTQSVAKEIFDAPAIAKAKETLKTLPPSNIKDLSGWAIRNATGFTGEPSLGQKFARFANKAKDRTARAFIDWNIPLHMYHLGELPTTVNSQLGNKYTTLGVKRALTSPVKTWKKTADLGLIQGEVKPLAFKTAGERYASAAQFFNAVERFVKGSTYEGALQKFLDKGLTPEAAAKEALRFTKDVTLDTAGPRKAKGFFSESNISGGELGGATGSQFKGVPAKIAEQMYDTAAAARKHPGKAISMALGSAAMMAATKAGAHTFHLNPASLIKTTAFGAYGTAMTEIANALYKGDYETAMEAYASWAVPGGQHVLKPAYEYLTDKEKRDKKKEEKMTKETRSGHPPTNSVRRAVDYVFGEEKPKPSPFGKPGGN